MRVAWNSYHLTLVGVDWSLVRSQVAVAAPERTAKNFYHVYLFLHLFVVGLVDHRQQVLADTKVERLVCVRPTQAREETVGSQLSHILRGTSFLPSCLSQCLDGQDHPFRTRRALVVTPISDKWLEIFAGLVHHGTKSEILGSDLWCCRHM